MKRRVAVSERTRFRPGGGQGSQAPEGFLHKTTTSMFPAPSACSICVLSTSTCGTASPMPSCSTGVHSTTLFHSRRMQVQDVARLLLAGARPPWL